MIFHSAGWEGLEGGGGVTQSQFNSLQRLCKIIPSTIAGGKGGVVYMSNSSASYQKGGGGGGGTRTHFFPEGNNNSVT